jgi:hypothetical protein
VVAEPPRGAAWAGIQLAAISGSRRLRNGAGRSGNIPDRPALFHSANTAPVVGYRQQLALVCLLVVDETVLSGQERIYGGGNYREEDRVLDAAGSCYGAGA